MGTPSIRRVARRGPLPRPLVLALALALGLALVATASCRGVSMRPEIAEQVARVDGARVRAHVLALDAIGPRPVSDAAATRAAADYVAGRMRELGFEVHEEPVELTFSGRLIANVRPMDDPDAELTEIELAPDLRAGGGHAMKAESARLAAEGWKVESYSLAAGGGARTLVVPNVIATRPGALEPERVVELSAHYDTVAGCPGADDNSSGVAALLEVARVLSETPTRRTLRFCFFGAEEVGLQGSAVHVAALRADPEAHLVGLINLDSVGFRARGPGSQREPDGVPWFLSLPDEGDFVAVIGKWSSGWLGNVFEDSIDAYVPDLPYYSANRIGSFFRDAARSDHSNYWKAGLPAIFLSDTGEFRGDAYHTPNDTPEKIDFAFLEAITRATLAAALHLAQPE